jgi:hypothetical protein
LARWLDAAPRSIAVVAPGKAALERSDVSRQLLSKGADGFSALKHGGIGNVHGRPVLALWLDDTQLDDLESHRPAKIALAPWQLDDARLWIATRHPLELGNTHVPAPPPLDPVVRTAIRSVCTMSNPGNGLNGYNKNFAVNAFRILRRAGYTWDPIETAVVMAEGGWALRNARDFAELSADMLAGKALQAGRSQWNSTILKQWRDRAEQDAPWP